MMAMCSSVAVESALSITDILAGTDTVVNILVNIIVIAGGILGFNYVKKLREKQVDSTFSYLMRLNVRLKYFREIFVTYKEEIMDCFLPEDCRRGISADRTYLLADTIKNISENAKETLKFLKAEDNQMPAMKGWTDCFNLFIGFLIDCEQLNQVSYFKWSARDNLEEKKNQYYDVNLNNIDRLLKMVHTRQSELEDKIFKNE